MNFALLMLILLLVTGAIWLLDYLVLHRRRDNGRRMARRNIALEAEEQRP